MMISISSASHTRTSTKINSRSTTRLRSSRLGEGAIPPAPERADCSESRGSGRCREGERPRVCRTRFLGWRGGAEREGAKQKSQRRARLDLSCLPLVQEERCEDKETHEDRGPLGDETCRRGRGELDPVAVPTGPGGREEKEEGEERGIRSARVFKLQRDREIRYSPLQTQLLELCFLFEAGRQAGRGKGEGNQQRVPRRD